MLFKQIVDSLYLPVFEYIAAVDFVQQFVQTSSAKQVMLNSPFGSWNSILYLNAFSITQVYNVLIVLRMLINTSFLYLNWDLKQVLKVI